MLSFVMGVNPKSSSTSQTSPKEDKKIKRSEVPTSPFPSKSEGQEDVSGQITEFSPSSNPSEYPESYTASKSNSSYVQLLSSAVASGLKFKASG